MYASPKFGIVGLYALPATVASVPKYCVQICPLSAVPRVAPVLKKVSKIAGPQLAGVKLGLAVAVVVPVLV
jgi:hypothetical protein